MVPKYRDYRDYIGILWGSWKRKWKLLYWGYDLGFTGFRFRAWGLGFRGLGR